MDKTTAACDKLKRLVKSYIKELNSGFLVDTFFLQYENIMHI